MSIKKSIFKKNLTPLIYSAINLASVRRFEIYLLVKIKSNINFKVDDLNEIYFILF